MNDDLKKLFEAVSAKYDVGDYNSFSAKMQTPKDRKSFYDAVGNQGFDLGDYNQYEKRLSVNSSGYNDSFFSKISPDLNQVTPGEPKISVVQDMKDKAINQPFNEDTLRVPIPKIDDNMSPEQKSRILDRKYAHVRLLEEDLLSKQSQLDSLKESIKGKRPDSQTRSSLTNTELEIKGLQKKIEKEKNKRSVEESYGGEVKAKLARGLDQAGNMIFGVPRGIGRVMAGVENAKHGFYGLPDEAKPFDPDPLGDGAISHIADYYAKKVENLNEIIKASPAANKSIEESLKGGDYSRAGKNLLSGIIESMPSSIAMMAAPASGAGTLGTFSSIALMTGTQFADENLRNPELKDIPNDQKIFAGMLNGIPEGLFETFLGSGAVASTFMDVIKKKGAETGVKEIKKGIIAWIRKMYAETPLVAQSTGNGLEEVATQLSQNWIDKYVLGKDIQISDGVIDAGLMGFGQGQIMGGATKLAQVAVKQKEKAQQREELFFLKKNIEDKVTSLTNKQSGEVVFAVDSKGKQYHIIDQIDEKSIAVVDAETGEPKMVGKTELNVINSILASDYSKQLLDEIMAEKTAENIQTASQELEQEQSLIDQIVTYQGKNYVVNAIDNDIAVVTPEGVDPGMGNSIEIPVSEINKEQEIPQVEPQAEQSQQNKGTFSAGGMDIAFEKREDGTFFVPFTDASTLDKTVRSLTKEIDTEKYDIVPLTEEIPIEGAPEFAKVKTQKKVNGIQIIPKITTDEKTNNQAETQKPQEQTQKDSKEGNQDQDPQEVDDKSVSVSSKPTQVLTDKESRTFRTNRPIYVHAFRNQQGDVMGSVYLTKTKKTWQIRYIRLNDEFQGKGYGKLIYRQLRDVARGNDAELVSDLDNIESSARIWEKFTEKGEAERIGDVWMFKGNKNSKQYADEAMASRRVDEAKNLPDIADAIGGDNQFTVSSEEVLSKMPEVDNFEGFLKIIDSYPDLLQYAKDKYPDHPKPERKLYKEFVNLDSKKNEAGKKYGFTKENYNTLIDEIITFVETEGLDQSYNQKIESYRQLLNQHFNEHTVRTEVKKNAPTGRSGDNGTTGTERTGRENATGSTQDRKGNEEENIDSQSTENVSEVPKEVKKEKPVEQGDSKPDKKLQAKINRQQAAKNRKRPARIEKVLSREPESIYEAILQYFVAGGRVDSEQIKRDIQGKGAESRSKIFLFGKKNGQKIDLLYEKFPNSFGAEDLSGYEFSQQVMDVINNNASIWKMVERLERLQEGDIQQQVPEEELSNEQIVEKEVENDAEGFREFPELVPVIEYYIDDSGLINWNGILEALENDIETFTQFPFGLSEDQINELINIIKDEPKRQNYERAIFKGSQESTGIEAGIPEDAGRQSEDRPEQVIPDEDLFDAPGTIEQQPETPPAGEQPAADIPAEVKSEAEDVSLTPIQQQELDKKLAEIDQQISDKKESLASTRKAREKEYSKLNQRNGLFGDTAAGPNDMFAGQFMFNQETVNKALQKYDEDIASIEKEITRLEKLREDTVKSAGDQGEIKFRRSVINPYSEKDGKVFLNVDNVSPEKGDQLTRQLAKQGFSSRPWGDWATFFREWKDQGITNEEHVKAIRKVFGQIGKESPRTDTQKIITKAKKYFGLTNNFREAGYLLPDGTMLDFSGKREGGSPGTRSFDHRQIGMADEYNADLDMISFMEDGNIRMMPEAPGLDITKEPTKEQYATIKRFAIHFGGDLMIDFYNPKDPYTKTGIDYKKGTNPDRIVNDIKRYYREGISPVAPSIRFRRSAIANGINVITKIDTRLLEIALKFQEKGYSISSRKENVYVTKNGKYVEFLPNGLTELAGEYMDIIWFKNNVKFSKETPVFTGGIIRPEWANQTLSPVMDKESYSKAETILNDLKSRTKADVTILRSQNQLAGVIRRQIEPGQRLKGVNVGTRNFIILDNLESVDEAIRTFIHEVGVHDGMGNIIPDREQRIAFFEKVVDDIGIDTIKAVVPESEWNLPKYLLGEEYMAYLAEKHLNGETLTIPEQTIWQKFIELINQILRKLGIETKITDQDVLKIAKDSIQSNISVRGSDTTDGRGGNQNTVQQGTESNNKEGSTQPGRRFAGELLGNQPQSPESNTPDPLFKRSTPKHTFAGEHLAKAGEIYKEKQEVKRSFKETLQGVREFFQDLNLSVRRFEEQLIKRGAKQNDNAKPYRDMNNSYGRLEKLFKNFTDSKMTPVMESVVKIVKSGMSGENILPYVICKHAIERNRELRDAEVNEWGNKRKAKTETLRKEFLQSKPSKEQIDNWDDQRDQEDRKARKAFISSLANKDYSGVMPLQEKKINPDGTVSIEYSNPDEFARVVVEEFEKNVDKKLSDDLWKSINDATRSILDTWVNAKEITPEQRTEYLLQYKNFVPLRGWREGVAEQLAYTKGEGFSKSLIKAEGRSSLAENPLAYIQNVAFKAINEQVDNEVKTSMLEFVSRNLARIEMSDMASIKKVYYVKIINPVDGTFEWEATLDKPPQELFDRGDAKTSIFNEHEKLRPPRLAKEHEVHVYRKTGDAVIVFTDPFLSVSQALNHKNYMYHSMMGDIKDARDLNKAFRGLGALNNIQKALYTSWNIVFPFTNIFRDAPEAAITQFIKTGHGADVIANYSKSFPAIIRDIAGRSKPGNKTDAYLKDFYLTGGATGYTHNKTPQEIEKELEDELQRMIRRGTISGEIGNSGRQLFKGIEIWNRIFEDATRLSVYISSIERGKTKGDAAADAKEASVNFNRKGKITPAIESLYAFTNVALQSMQKNLSIAKNNPGKFSLVVGGFIALGFFEAMMNNSWGDDPEDKEDDYFNINPYMRENYLILPNIPKILATGEKGDKYLSIPLPQFWRGFKAIGALAYEVNLGRITPSEAMGKAMVNFISSLFPIDVPGFWETGKFSFAPLVPTVFKPLSDIAYNRNYAGYTIAKEPFTAEQKKMLSDNGLGKQNVNQAAKFFTDVLFRWGGGDSPSKYYMSKEGIEKKVPGIIDINPSKLEHIITGYTGGTGKVFVDLLTTIMQVADKEQEVDFKNMPFVNRFIRETPESKWNVIKEYYSLKEVPAIHKDLKRGYRKQAEVTGEDKQYDATGNNDYYEDFTKIMDDYDKSLDKKKEEMDFYNDIEGTKEMTDEMQKCIDEINTLKQKYKMK